MTNFANDTEFLSCVATVEEQKRYLEPLVLLNGGKAMPYFPLKQRLQIALGGFVFFIGFMLLIFAFLTMTKAVNLEGVMQNEIIIAVAAVVGVLDVVCGFLLFQKRRK